MSLSFISSRNISIPRIQHIVVSYKKSINLLLFFFISGLVQAQTNFAVVDDWLQENVSKMGGRALLVVYKDGKIIYTNAVNEMSGRQKRISKFIARRKGGEATTGDYDLTTRQPIASCSKWLSAALVMSFVDEGELKLTDTVGKYLPVLSEHGKGNITVSQCLSHLTAIKEPDLKESLKNMYGITSMDEAIANIALLPMEGQPGKVFHYSNAGLQIAGAVIEKISGKSFETLFAERIAKPLQMKNTDFGKGKVALPAGGANATPEDYLNFLVMILNKGSFNGKQILSEQSIEQMQINRVTSDVQIAYAPAEAGSIKYGYGEWVMQPATADQQNAWVSSPGLFGSFPWVNYQKGYAAFLMTYYFKSEGRGERYKALKALVDDAVK